MSPLLCRHLQIRSIVLQMMTLFKGFFGFRKDLINKISVLSHNQTSVFRLIMGQKKRISLHVVGFYDENTNATPAASFLRTRESSLSAPNFWIPGFHLLGWQTKINEVLQDYVDAAR